MCVETNNDQIICATHNLNTTRKSLIHTLPTKYPKPTAIVPILMGMPGI